MDFTKLLKVGRYKYLLVIVDQLTHWVETYPVTQTTAHFVTKIILEEIIPRFGMIGVTDSDQGSHFTSKVLKEVMKALGISWE